MTAKQAQALAQRIEREEPTYKVWTISRRCLIVQDTETGAFCNVTSQAWEARQHFWYQPMSAND